MPYFPPPSAGGAAQFDEDGTALRLIDSFSRIAQEIVGDDTDATFVQVVAGLVYLYSTGVDPDRVAYLSVKAGDDPQIVLQSAGPSPTFAQTSIQLDSSVAGAVNINSDGQINLSAPKGLTLPTAAADPGSPIDGQIIYRTDTDKLRLRANGAWVDLN